MSIMSDRFNRERWSPTRKKIDALKSGKSASFPNTEYFNCKSSVDRFNDAYDGERQFEIKGARKAKRIIVTRVL